MGLLPTSVTIVSQSLDRSFSAGSLLTLCPSQGYERAWRLRYHQS